MIWSYGLAEDDSRLFPGSDPQHDAGFELGADLVVDHLGRRVLRGADEPDTDGPGQGRYRHDQIDPDGQGVFGLADQFRVRVVFAGLGDQFLGVDPGQAGELVDHQQQEDAVGGEPELTAGELEYVLTVFDELQHVRQQHVGLGCSPGQHGKPGFPQ